MCNVARRHYNVALSESMCFQSILGLGFSSLSYDGLIRFGAGIDEGIYRSPDHVKSLVRRVIEELHILKADSVV